MWIFFCNDWKNMDVDFNSSRFAACLRMIWKLEERLDKLWPLVCLHVLLFHEHLWYSYIIIATKTKRENSMRVGDESVYCVFLVVLWINFVFKVPHPSCVQAGGRVRDDRTWCAKYTSFEMWSVMTCGKKKPKKRARSQRWGKVGTGWELLSMFSGNSKRHILMSASQVFCWVEY